MNSYPGNRPDLRRIMEGALRAREKKDHPVFKDLYETAHYAAWAEAQCQWQPIANLPPDEEVVLSWGGCLHIGRYTTWNGEEYEWMVDGVLSGAPPADATWKAP